MRRSTPTASTSTSTSATLGERGLYGYCAVDDSRTRSPYRYDAYAGYCVLDDDFARTQFPANSPTENLRVTAAHEFFHAIQFAYDATEDAWFMEGTSAWIEDEIYDSVNDNRYYLRTSQFKEPSRPLDTSRGFAVYGTWGFFRFLSERLGADVVRRAWERADASKRRPQRLLDTGAASRHRGRGRRPHERPR